ncbi:hypothetical protein OMP38_12795 [Cohnella ginsengisoli]|uniref:Uncharacterized protein n=1 Tax=Cohnella ginsengisoli TaxID=425004 RepID=A0A9X4KGP1_9BACL|nr:hypothetical protein [Cohnella ginsengisoli]MDG0791650.1 hypothetical protein [Cohnella ginsengisoli]
MIVRLGFSVALFAALAVAQGASVKKMRGKELAAFTLLLLPVLYQDAIYVRQADWPSLPELMGVLLKTPAAALDRFLASGGNG